ncbi:MAG TPA: DNA ligase D, partial [Flavobacterium sp.]|nr:DNA ligase D [Flavobacterium sp.]
MGLEKYNEKRDFTKTKEPKGIQKTSKGALTFVVQKHAASHLHYDFRLEIDGVLVSWAVPKGPSANTSDKRLAMQTEDHPMGYFDFEGIIPKGEYGGGTVMVWDFGTYRPENAEGPVSQDNKLMKKQLAEGSIKIMLKGKKLQGAWNLVKTKGRQENMWLLIKSKDEFAGSEVEYGENSAISGMDFKGIENKGNIYDSKKRKEVSETLPESTESKKGKNKPETIEFDAEDLADAVKIDSFPENWRPQLATLADEAFDDGGWLFENKFDGYRALAQVRKGQVDLISRNGISFNTKYKPVVEALQTLRDEVIIDGEVVVEDENGKSGFQLLQDFEGNKQGKLKMYVFDILYFNGYDLRRLDLVKRKKILKAILPKLDSVVFSSHTVGHGIETFKAIEKLRGEGIIAKKITSKYNENKRSKDWLKIKTARQQEMVIGGFSEPQGSRNGIGALLCGYFDGDDLIYSGKVGTGFSDEALKELRAKLNLLERKTSPFKVPPRMQGIHWVNPELVAQLKFTEWTNSGSLRHPVFLGLREDKDPKEVVREKETAAEKIVGTPQPKEKQEAPSKTVQKKKAMKKEEKEPLDISGSKVEFSNLDKIFWPKEKYTKGDVIEYYNSVASYILPYLKDRPESLKRTPNGIAKEGFFQKNVEGQVPDWVKTRKLKSKTTGESITYLLCQDRDTLLFLANWGCIEINPWSSRIGTLNNPDYIIFDLDPNEAGIEKIVKTALALKEILDALQVPAYIKTSGGKGLHVFIPVLPK